MLGRVNARANIARSAGSASDRQRNPVVAAGLSRPLARMAAGASVCQVEVNPNSRPAISHQSAGVVDATPA